MNPSTTIRPTRASSAIRPWLLAAALLGGCASYGPGPLRAGQSEAEVVARMGTPTLRAVRADGSTRLDFARGPMGQHTYRVELDAGGRVRAIEQLLTERNFDTVRPGQTADQVRDTLGPAAQTRVGWRGVGEVWFYRYDWRMNCRWFSVWLVDGRVREAGYDIDPLCEEVRKTDGLP